MGTGVLSVPRRTGRGALQLDAVDLEMLAGEVGTPAYVYGASRMREQFGRLAAALQPTRHRIHYACKANGNLALLRVLRACGASIDVVSGGELYRARAAGFAPDQIMFGGVGKSAREIGEALDAGIRMINAESREEVALINAIAGDRGVVAPIGLRVNPEVSVESVHDYIKTGQRGDKFGVPVDQAAAVAAVSLGMPNVRLVGIGMHIGSQVTRLESFATGLARLEALVGTFRSAGVATLEDVDIGGGLFVPYDDEAPADVDAYAALVIPFAQRLSLTLVVEPGRFLVADAGLLLTRVLYRKRSGGREVLVTDAGMNDLLRPSHYQAFHRIEAVAGAAGAGRFDVVGPICESGDFFAIDRDMDDVQPGALLCVHTTGAYGYCMASNYNARPRAVEVLVDGARWAVVTGREQYADLVRLEVATPTWRTA